jgi:hypothetical protein
MRFPTTDALDTRASWLLILAHPGHELRAHHLLECVRPIVTVLTDGSGSTGVARVDESCALLADVGARRGPVFGALTDQDAYAALVGGDASVFIEQVDRLVDVIRTESVTDILVDAAEGYNPVHDVCHWMARAAVARAEDLGCRLSLYELDLVSHPDGCGSGVRLTLDDEAFARKLRAVGAYQALAAEAGAAFALHGRDAFRVEFLRRVPLDRELPSVDWLPYYEEVGAARVREGRYASTLRYASHVRPVIDSLIGFASAAPDAKDGRTPHE